MADDLGGDFHCAVLVKPIIAGQQAVCHSSSGIMDSTEEALECEVQLTPTIQLQNGLPYPMIVTLNVGLGRANVILFFRWCTSTGRTTNDQTRYSLQECEDSSHSRPPGVNMEPSPGHGMNVTLKQLRSEGFSMHSAKGSSLHMPSGMWGDQTCRILLPPGTTSDVYMNLKKNVYAKFEVPALKLKCAEWVVLHKCHALKHRAQFHYDAVSCDAYMITQSG